MAATDLADAPSRRAQGSLRQARLLGELGPAHGRERRDQPLFDELSAGTLGLLGQLRRLLHWDERGAHDQAVAGSGAHAPGPIGSRARTADAASSSGGSATNCS